MNLVSLNANAIPFLYSVVFIGTLLASTRSSAAQPLRFEKLPQNYGNDGVGLSVYLGSQLSNSLFKLALENENQFENIAYFSDDMKTADLSQMHCKAMVWRPLTGSEKNDYNRIHCEVSWGSNPKKFFVALTNDQIGAEEFPYDPSFSIQGKFTTALVSLISKNRGSNAFLDRYQVKIIHDHLGKEFFVLGSTTNRDPFLMCENSSGSPNCQLKWPFVQAAQRRVHLGDFGIPLGKATCAQKDSLMISGRCPSDWNEVTALECSFVGAWVSHDAWGAIDRAPKLSCSYVETSHEHAFEIPLGPVITRAWGSRFGLASISITGSGLKALYKVLKEHAKSKKADRNYPIDYSDLGSGEWGMQSVSLRRYAFPHDNLLSALSCEFTDTSYSTFRQVPHKNFIFEREQYSCTIHIDARN